MKPTTSMNPTSFAVIFNSFNSIVEEMSLTFEYSAWSSVIAEVSDFSCAIYDAGDSPSALCVLDGLPIHVNAQPVTISEIAKFFRGNDDINDGDVFIVNSAYYGGTHVGDFVVAAPVFVDGEHLFWAAATGHHMDVGSHYATSVPVLATDIWSEGLQIPPVKIEEGGRVRTDVMNFILENVRYRDFVAGDLMSQIGSVKTGQRRLMELIEKWGPETLRQFSAEITAYADRITGEEIRSWPDGTYTAESWVDSDAHGTNNIAIRCALTIDGDMVTADFTGTDPQGRGGVNAGWATCQNSVSTAILMCLDPDLPHNEGCLRHINVVAPKGTIVNAEWPASTAGATVVPADAITDAVWKCLAQAIPEKSVAGTGHVTPISVTTGVDRRIPDAERPFGTILINGSSGGGASRSADGWPVMVTPGTRGAQKLMPIEMIELQYPLVVERNEIRADSMGAGEFRGGPGLWFDVTPRGTGQIDIYGYGDGMLNPPFGLFGGKPADGGALYRINRDGTKNGFGPLAYFRVCEGEVWCAVSTGGGGYGNPLARDPLAVQTDTRDGFISLDSARDDYGVVLDPATFEIDELATKELRRKLTAAQATHTFEPRVPGASTYHRDIMGAADSFVLEAHPPEDADLTL